MQRFRPARVLLGYSCKFHLAVLDGILLRCKSFILCAVTGFLKWAFSWSLVREKSSVIFQVEIQTG